MVSVALPSICTPIFVPWHRRGRARCVRYQCPASPPAVRAGRRELTRASPDDDESSERAELLRRPPRPHGSVHRSFDSATSFALLATRIPCPRLARPPAGLIREGPSAVSGSRSGRGPERSRRSSLGASRLLQWRRCAVSMHRRDICANGATMRPTISRTAKRFGVRVTRTVVARSIEPRNDFRSFGDLFG